MSQWHPIDTAPKDGTRVLIAFDGEVRAAFWDPEFSYGEWDDDANNATHVGAWTDRAVHSFGYEEVKSYEPTHWMPIPTPPDAAVEPSEDVDVVDRVAKWLRENTNVHAVLTMAGRLLDECGLSPVASDVEPVAWADLDKHGQAESLGFKQSSTCSTPLYTPAPPLRPSEPAGRRIEGFIGEPHGNLAKPHRTFYSPESVPIGREATPCVLLLPADSGTEKGEES